MLNKENSRPDSYRDLSKKKQQLKMFIASIVTAMMFSASANAQIVYTDVIPDTTVICLANGCTQSYNLDLNNDGLTDFLFKTTYSGVRCPRGSYGIVRSVSVVSQTPNRVMPNMMSINNQIGSNLAFSDSTATLRSVLTGSFCNGSSGNWTSTLDHYLGLQITMGANTYYGWVRLNVGVSNIAYFSVKDYAYNSIPNEPIFAGQTIATGIDENTFASSINLFPNPANDHLTIALGSLSKNVKVTIADITGKIIYTATTDETDKIEVNTNEFAEGLYTVRIQTGEYIATKKILVKK